MRKPVRTNGQGLGHVINQINLMDLVVDFDDRMPGCYESGSESGEAYEIDSNMADVDMVAISFDYSYYEEKFPHPNKYVSWMLGRVQLLGCMLKDGVINTDKPHHLLGCGLPQEFSFYHNAGWDWIYSLDTSNPVVHGLKGIEYKDSGLWDKESQKLFTMINSDVTKEQLSTIKYNINMFRQLANGTTSLDSIL